jgi:hypothetical protein
VVEKGNLKALEDPAVRDLAEQLGDADELLRKAWIPPVPGSTVAGDYAADYAQDPATWLDEHPADARAWE